MLRRKGAPCIALCDALAVDEEGQFVMIPPMEEKLNEFRRSVLPAPEMGSGKVFFPTPPGATWGDVRIRFLDSHMVSVQVGEQRGIFHFTQMGMADLRSGNPTVQWELLRNFAEGYGLLTWKSRGADRRNKKRREKLAKDLQDFFRIDGDPFTASDDGWQVRFAIDPSP